MSAATPVISSPVEAGSGAATTNEQMLNDCCELEATLELLQPMYAVGDGPKIDARSMPVSVWLYTANLVRLRGPAHNRYSLRAILTRSKTSVRGRLFSSLRSLPSPASRPKR